MLNDFVAVRLATGEITVLSDGTPWRPLIDVADMARAIEWAIRPLRRPRRPLPRRQRRRHGWNYQVRELARRVADAVPGTKVSINREAPPDKRSYQVDFSLFQSLAPAFTPKVTLAQSIAGLKDGLTSMGFVDTNFRNSQNIRLKVLEAHLAAGRLGQDLRWAQTD